MKKNFVIKRSNVRTGLSIHGTILMLISLDHWNATDIVRGIFYTIFAFAWILVIRQRLFEEEVDIFDFENDDQASNNPVEKVKSKFQLKLEEMAKQRGIDLTKKQK